MSVGNSKNPQCPRCEGRTTKKGFRITVKRGRTQRFQCVQCGHVFVEAV